MIDRYTKVVLTVIAISLSVLAIGQFASPAQAQKNDSCGEWSNPCYVRTGGRPPEKFEVKIVP